MLPSEPVMLLSYINLKLRDFYGNLDILCDELDISRSELETKLNAINYHYDENINQFI